MATDLHPALPAVMAVLADLEAAPPCLPMDTDRLAAQVRRSVWPELTEPVGIDEP